MHNEFLSLSLSNLLSHSVFRFSFFNLNKVNLSSVQETLRHAIHRFKVLQSLQTCDETLYFLSLFLPININQPLSCCLRARFWHAIKPLQYQSCLLNSSIEINWRPEFLLTQHPVGFQFNTYPNLHLIYTLIKRYLFMNRKCLRLEKWANRRFVQTNDMIQFAIKTQFVPTSVKSKSSLFRLDLSWQK